MCAIPGQLSDTPTWLAIPSFSLPPLPLIDLPAPLPCSLRPGARAPTTRCWQPSASTGSWSVTSLARQSGRAGRRARRSSRRSACEEVAKGRSV